MLPLVLELAIVISRVAVTFLLKSPVCAVISAPAHRVMISEAPC